MKSRAMLLMAGLVMVACSGMQPVQIAAGDVCFRCRKMINEPRIAAEVIDKDGRAFKFRTAGCMAKFLKANPNEKFDGLFATDFATGRLVKVSAVKFVPTMLGEGRDRALDYVAYYAEEGAAEAARRENTTPIQWDAVLAAATPD
jgi:hypothetical protein